MASSVWKRNRAKTAKVWLDSGGDGEGFGDFLKLPLLNARHEKSLNCVTFPPPLSEAKGVQPWSSPLPVPKASHSARRFAKSTQNLHSAALSPERALRKFTTERIIAAREKRHLKSAAPTGMGKSKSCNALTAERTQEMESAGGARSAPRALLTKADEEAGLNAGITIKQGKSISGIGLNNDKRPRIVRTVEEKLQNPDAIKLDNCGLTQFPIIDVPSEPNLRLLSLQNNLITKLDNNVATLNQLVVLDLYNNRIDKIHSLQGLNSLRVLLLGKNRLRRFEGIECLKRLEILDLHGNQLRHIENLGCLVALRVLNLAGNCFKTIKFGSFGLTALTELNLKRNRIRNLEGLHKAPHLQKLYLSNNEIGNPNTLASLQKLVYLQEVLFDPNPICQLQDYKSHVISTFPSLETLDRSNITDSMRAEAKAWARKRIVEEEEQKRKKEQVQAAFAVAPPAPKTRDEIIGEARKRWQSLRKFVKTSSKERPKKKTKNTIQIEEENTEGLMPFRKSPTPAAPALALTVNELESTMLYEDLKSPEAKEGVQETAVAVVDEGMTEGTSMVVVPAAKTSKVAVVRPVVRVTDAEQVEVPVKIDDEEGPSPGPGELKLATSMVFENSTETTIEVAQQEFPKSVRVFEEAPQDPSFFDNVQDLVDDSGWSTVSTEVSPKSIEGSAPRPRAVLQRSCSFIGTSSTAFQSTSTITKMMPLQEEVRAPGATKNPKLAMLAHLRSASFDVGYPRPESLEDAEEDEDDDDTASFLTSNTSDLGTGRSSTASRNKLFPRRIFKKSTKFGPPGRRPVTGIKEGNRLAGKMLKRCDSAILESSLAATETVKKQGADYLVEVDGKILNVYGQGALKFALSAFAQSLCGNVTTAKFHYITFDTLIPFFGKIRQTYPNLEHFQFRANNLTCIAQLNSLADLQGITSLHIAKEGNSIISNDLWQPYASYRLAHWGLQNISGKEAYLINPHRDPSKCFESLGYIALSCLPQTALTPLAKRLHTFHCFCCCSPSSSIEEPGRKRQNGTTNAAEAQESTCTSWDDDPVLLDVIGKEALIYSPLADDKETPTPNRAEIMERIVDSGFDTLEKLELLDQVWPSLMVELVEDVLSDYVFIDSYMKRELKKLQDLSLISKKYN